MIEDGRIHLLFGNMIRTHCPVIVLQGMRDEDVPYGHALALMERLGGDPATLTLIKDGDHRLSRPQDLRLMFDALGRLIVSAPKCAAKKRAERRASFDRLGGGGRYSEAAPKRCRLAP